MAVHISAGATGGLKRTLDLLNYNSPYTVAFWIYPEVLPASGTGNTIVILDPVAALSYDGADIHNTAGTTNLSVFSQNNNTNFVQTFGTTALSANTWYHIALVRTSVTQILLYLNGVLEITVTELTVAARPALEQMYIGSDNASYMNGRWMNPKLWAANLTAAEILQEMQSLRPARFTSLYNWSPTWPGVGERARDYSGNGRDWAETGTLTDEDPPPVSYGAPSLFALPTFAQVAAPASDVSVGGWTTAPLWSQVDEPVPDDTNVIQSSVNPSADQAELALGPLIDPAKSDGHVVRYRIRLVS